MLKIFTISKCAYGFFCPLPDKQSPNRKLRLRALRLKRIHAQPLRKLQRPSTSPHESPNSKFSPRLPSIHSAQTPADNPIIRAYSLPTTAVPTMPAPAVPSVPLFASDSLPLSKLSQVPRALFTVPPFPRIGSQGRATVCAIPQ